MVRMPLPSPKVVALARLIRSSLSLNEIAEITGPKISSFAIRMLSCTLANTVGGTKYPFDNAPGVSRAPPASALAPSF